MKASTALHSPHPAFARYRDIDSLMSDLKQYINIQYPVISDLLDLSILYLGRYITHNKGEYYRLIQAELNLPKQKSDRYRTIEARMPSMLSVTASNNLYISSGTSISGI